MIMSRSDRCASRAEKGCNSILKTSPTVKCMSCWVYDIEAECFFGQHQAVQQLEGPVCFLVYGISEQQAAARSTSTGTECRRHHPGAYNTTCLVQQTQNQSPWWHAIRIGLVDARLKLLLRFTA
jgi:hypothetical protein